MATYAQLQAEPAWNAETEAPATAAFNTRLRARYGLTRSQCGSKGDNNHLRGRHRSRRWSLESRYCTDRDYGTQDARDRRGDGDWLRATDIGISGAEHHAVSRRLDAAVRAGQLPELAEWFGSVDGRTVVGWFEGHASSSDDSHLYHIHIGWWTQYADDAGFFAQLYEIITGDDMTPQELLGAKLGSSGPTVGVALQSGYAITQSTAAAVAGLSTKLDLLGQAVQILGDALAAGGSDLDTAAILARIDNRAAEDAARDAAHATEVDQLQAEIHRLTTALAKAGEAQAALDDPPAGS